MALTEQTEYYIGIKNDGQIEFLRSRHVMDGTELVGEKHYRQVLEPGQDVTTFPPRLRQVANVVWTPAVIAAYQAAKAAAQSQI